MTEDDTKLVVAKIAVGDKRVVDAETILYWHELISHLDLKDCLDAVTMFRQESVSYLMPANIVQNVKRIREERAENAKHERLTGEWRLRGDNKPHNFDEMSVAWNDPVRWGMEVAKYQAQLEDEANGVCDVCNSQT